MSLRAELFGDVYDRRWRRGAGLGEVLRAELGDVICTQDEGDAGDAAITELLTLYRAAGYKPTKYLTAVQAIALERQQLGAQTIVNPTTYWCQLKALGQRARALYEQIALDTGQAPTPKPPDAPNAIGDALKALGSAILGAAALAAVARFFSERKAR
jgi:hypothetical protein